MWQYTHMIYAQYVLHIMLLGNWINALKEFLKMETKLDLLV